MNRLVGHFRLVEAASMGALALTLAGAAVPAFAQDTMADTRLRKLESEVRAMQRVVFPGSADGKVFKPEITQGTVAAQGVGQPATSAVSDLLTRMDTLEAQVAKLTGQVEQNGYRISQIEARLGTAPAAAVTPAPGTPAPAPTNLITPTPSPAPTPTPAPSPTPKPAASGPSADRVAAVRAVEKPQSNDPGEDDYSYGYRLWDAKFYPEAEQQLKLFVGKYPKHPRISFGRNLLGRSYLDEGNPGEAAKWFLQNYQIDKKGDRAPDSLLNLAIAMKQMKDSKRACIALTEFGDTYAAEAAGRLKSTYVAARNGLTCN